jgi:hypothetical protein
MRTIKPLYDARLEDLQPDDRVKVECRCEHIELFPPMSFLQGLRLPPYTPVLDLQPRFRCRECDTKGVVIVSVRWGKRTPDSAC